MFRTATASALAVALAATGSAAAGTHSLFVIENNGYTSFDSLDLSVTISDAGDDWNFLINNDSTDGTFVTGVYFEVDTLKGQDFDWSRYGLTHANPQIDAHASDDNIALSYFTSLHGFASFPGVDLTDAQIDFTKHVEHRNTVSDLDSTIADPGYRIVYTVSDGENSAVMITGLGDHAASPVLPKAMPTPTAALAGCCLLGALVARRRRKAA